MGQLDSTCTAPPWRCAAAAARRGSLPGVAVHVDPFDSKFRNKFSIYRLKLNRCMFDLFTLVSVSLRHTKNESRIRSWCRNVCMA
jgi:hypothetical protein